MVLAAQVMLDSAGFSPGEIDGRAGANFGRALHAFQQGHGLAARVGSTRRQRSGSDSHSKSSLLS
jgi:peptidoglycan hydrolase-like protein with peptidoglycan-binding domain